VTDFVPALAVMSPATWCHGRLVTLVVRPIEVGHPVADVSRNELVQV
jgi:hypothetical protein